MKTTIQHIAFIALLVISVFTGCKKDKDEVVIPPPPANESEVMTTFKLTFTDSAGAVPIANAQFRDPDGDGGNTAIQFDTIKLFANKTYIVNTLILDETQNPVDTISKEIQEEANDHLFFYTPATINATITILDQDTHIPSLPLGLQTKWKTMTASDGTVHIVLRHQPGIKDGTYAPGETDIDLTFQVKIE